MTELMGRVQGAQRSGADIVHLDTGEIVTETAGRGEPVAQIQ